jgi:hypothetical protein
MAIPERLVSVMAVLWETHKKRDARRPYDQEDWGLSTEDALCHPPPWIRGFLNHTRAFRPLIPLALDKRSKAFQRNSAVYKSLSFAVTATTYSHRDLTLMWLRDLFQRHFLPVRTESRFAGGRRFVSKRRPGSYRYAQRAADQPERHPQQCVADGKATEDRTGAARNRGTGHRWTRRLRRAGGASTVIDGPAAANKHGPVRIPRTPDGWLWTWTRRAGCHCGLALSYLGLRRRTRRSTGRRCVTPPIEGRSAAIEATPREERRKGRSEEPGHDCRWNVKTGSGRSGASGNQCPTYGKGRNRRAPDRWRTGVGWRASGRRAEWLTGGDVWRNDAYTQAYGHKGEQQRDSYHHTSSSFVQILH